MIDSVTTTAPPLARCIIRGCAWRFTDHGPDRMCAEHGRDGLVSHTADRIAALMTAPGDDEPEARRSRAASWLRRPEGWSAA
jgi:hypothetical protein